MELTNRPVLNVNLYISERLDDAEAERLATIMSEALEHHGFDRVTTHGLVPRWRRLVDEQDLYPEPPLPAVLYDLSWLAGATDTESGKVRDRESLARIIAVCEREVGDGWQADPDFPRVRCSRNDGGPCSDVQCLIDALAKEEQSRWMVLAGRAAAWLAKLTGEAA